MRRKRNNAGFNLVETIVASVILSGSVLTLGAIGTRALIETRLDRQYEVAASLIDRQLRLIDYAGIDEFVEMGQVEGVFEEYQPLYSWKVSTEYEGIDSVYLVTITVSWIERNRPHRLSVQTMFNGTSLIMGTTTQQE